MPEARIQSLTGVSTPLATSSIMAMEDTRFKKSGLLVISSAITVFDSLAKPFFACLLHSSVCVQPIAQRRLKESRPGGPRRIGSRKAGWKDLVSSSYGLVLLRRKSQVFSLGENQNFT